METAAIATSATTVSTAVSAPAIAAGTATLPTRAGRLGFVMFTGFFRCPIFEDGLAGKPDLAFRADIGHHHGQFLAEVDNVFNPLNPLAGELEM